MRPSPRHLSADVDVLQASLVVCTRNRPELLVDGVRSVLAGEKVPAEIVIIDQSDRVQGALCAWEDSGPSHIRYVWSPEVGVSRGRNLGATHAHHHVIVFTDDDVLVPPTWLGAIVGPIVSNEVEVVTGRVLSAATEGRGYFAPALVTSTNKIVHAGRPGRDVLEAGNMCLRRGTLQKIGGFDERLGPGTRFPAGEDNDLGFRLLESGCRIAYDPGAVLYHRPWRSRGEYVPLQWRYGVGQGAYYGKHLNLHDGYMARRMVKLILHHLRVGRLRLRREPRKACGNLMYICGLLYGALLWRLSTVGPREN